MFGFSLKHSARSYNVRFEFQLFLSFCSQNTFGCERESMREREREREIHAMKQTVFYEEKNEFFLEDFY